MERKMLYFFLGFFFVNHLYGQTIERTYDTLGRLSHELYPDSSSVIYTYDNMGNVIGISTHDPCSTKPKPIITASGPLTICAGDSVFLSTATGLQYRWSTGDTTQTIKVMAGGNYTIMRLDSFSIPGNDTIQCPLLADSVTITIKPIPNLVLPSNQIKCHGFTTDSITFTDTIPGTIYPWSNGNTSIGLTDTGTG